MHFFSQVASVSRISFVFFSFCYPCAGRFGNFSYLNVKMAAAADEDFYVPPLYDAADEDGNGSDIYDASKLQLCDSTINETE